MRRLSFLKELFLIAICSYALLITGCPGPGPNKPAVNPNAPVIKNMVISPNSATLNQGGGAIDVQITYDFTDADGNVQTFTVTGFDAVTGAQDFTDTEPINGAGITSGNDTLTIPGVDTTSATNERIELYITDASGFKSNTLTGTFTVTGGSSTSAPAAPTGVHAAAGDGEITISWTPVTGATSYNIYWAYTAGVTKSAGNKLPNQTNPQLLTAINGTTYYAVVTAVNANGESVESAEVSATPAASGNSSNSVPAAPTGVHAVAGDGHITLSWTPVTGATSYNIYWSYTAGVTKSTGYELLNQANPQGLTAGNGTTYYLVVTAVNANGESVESAEVNATPAASANTAPPAPTGVTATEGIGKFTVGWDSVSGATSYNFYWSNTKGVTKSTGTKIANVASPAPFTGSAGVTYYFVVTAENANGESAESAQGCAIPQDGVRYYIPCSAL